MNINYLSIDRRTTLVYLLILTRSMTLEDVKGKRDAGSSQQFKSSAFASKIMLIATPFEADFARCFHQPFFGCGPVSKQPMMPQM